MIPIEELILTNYSLLFCGKWISAIIGGCSAILGALVGGLIAWAVANKQMKRTSRQAFVSAGLQAMGSADALTAVLTALRTKQVTPEVLKVQFENQQWFEYLTSPPKARKIRTKILQNLEKQENWDKVAEALGRLVEGDW